MDKKFFELLVVDDDAGDVDLIREALDLSSNRPFQVNLSQVEDGEKALAFLNRKESYENAIQPDLILLDLNMPRKGGFEVLQKIKSNKELDKIPVIVLTTSSTAEDARMSSYLGAEGFITKAEGFAEFSKIVQVIESYWYKSKFNDGIGTPA